MIGAEIGSQPSDGPVPCAMRNSPPGEWKLVPAPQRRFVPVRLILLHSHQ